MMTHVKHFFAFAFLAVLSLTAGNVEELINHLSSEDYDLRYQSLLDLKAEVARATNIDSNIADRTSLEQSFLQSISREQTPLQTKVYLVRLLALIGEENTIQRLSEIALSSKIDPLLKENVIQAIASNPTEFASDVLLKGIEQATEVDKIYWWTSLAYQAPPAIDSKLSKWLNNTRNEMTNNTILSIGKMGGTSTVEFLYRIWEKGEETNKSELEQALLHTESCSSNMLENLLKHGDNASVRTGAYLQLIHKDLGKAENFLATQLNETTATNRGYYIDAALDSGESTLWKQVIAAIDKLTESELKILFVSIDENRRIEYESTVLSWIDNATVGTTAIRSLASIGGPKSTETLIQSLQSNNEDIQDAAIYALSRIMDSNLDETMMKLAKNDKDPAQRSAINILSIRNCVGAVELINELIYKGTTKETLKALLSAAEKIGNIDTCKVLASAVINESNKSERKKYQVSLKRLSASLILNDQLWREVYHPALMIASQSEQKTSLIEILDGISSDGALAYCINLEQTSSDNAILKSIGSVFNRWRNLNISSYWLERIESKSLSPAEVKSSIRSVIRLMKADYVVASERQIATTCAELFMGSSKDELKKEIFPIVEKLNRWVRRDFVNLLRPALDVSKFRTEIEEQIDPLWR